MPAGTPPTIRSAASGPGGRWGSVVLGWRALRPPRVVFVKVVASLINLSLQAKVCNFTKFCRYRVDVSSPLVLYTTIMIFPRANLAGPPPVEVASLRNREEPPQNKLTKKPHQPQLKTELCAVLAALLV